MAHAAECVLDDKKYIYTNAQGSSLMFNSIYSLIGVTFDGLTYIPMHSLPAYQRVVASLHFTFVTLFDCHNSLYILPESGGGAQAASF